MGNHRPLFHSFSVFSNKHYIFTTYKGKIYPSSTWYWDSNPRPIWRRESPPVTTRPGLPPNLTNVRDSGCGSVGWEVASHTRHLQFVSSYWQILWTFNHVELVMKDENKEKNASNGPFIKANVRAGAVVIGGASYLRDVVSLNPGTEY